jgi:protein-S-isoprenylcysteine O-methyltransferase Ste14
MTMMHSGSLTLLCVLALGAFPAMALLSPTLSHRGSNGAVQGSPSYAQTPCSFPRTPTLLYSMNTDNKSSTPSSSSSSSPVSDLTKMVNDVDFSSLLDNKDQIVKNVSDGEFGKRGEVYVVAQFVLLGAIFFGGVPVVGDFLFFLLGPGLLLLGIGTTLLGLNGLGASLSPWPVPSSNTQGLVRDGIYGQVRHPVYAGLLAAAAGFAIVSGSATRLLLTAALWYLLDLKSDFEEDALAAQFPDYDDYQTKVPQKFVPQVVLNALPWTVQIK